MERNQAISVAVGVGAVGTALAYLAYSYSNGEDDTANITGNTKRPWYETLFENSNTENDEKVTEAANPSNNESKSGVDGEKENKSAGWGGFWRNEYADAKNKKINICEDKD